MQQRDIGTVRAPGRKRRLTGTQHMQYKQQEDRPAGAEKGLLLVFPQQSRNKQTMTPSERLCSRLRTARG